MSKDRDNSFGKASAAPGETAAQGEAGFRAGAVVAVVTVAGLLFLVALYAFLSERSGPDQGDRRAPSSTGVTAIGLGAFNALLRRLDRTVEAKAGVEDARYFRRGSVVIVSDANDEKRLRDLRHRYDRAGAIVVVLPKWRIPWLTFGDRFAERVWLISKSEPQRAADHLRKAGLAREAEPLELERQDGAFAAPARNPLSIAPTIEKAQLLRGGGLEPVIAAADGAMLLAQIPTRRDGLPPLYVLSDPDPLLNHGLDDGDNALFAIRLVEWLGGTRAPIAFDDGPGAPTTPASFWIALFKPPLIAVTFAVIALFMALGLLAIARFGSRAADRPGQAAGKEALLDAAAALLRQGDGDRIVIRRFFDETARDVARALQGPRQEDDRGLIGWLEQAERARRVAPRIASLNRAVASAETGARPSAEALTALAQDINAWREEMLSGHA